MMVIAIVMMKVMMNKLIAIAIATAIAVAITILALMIIILNTWRQAVSLNSQMLKRSNTGQNVDRTVTVNIVVALVWKALVFGYVALKRMVLDVRIIIVMARPRSHRLIIVAVWLKRMVSRCSSIIYHRRNAHGFFGIWIRAIIRMFLMRIYPLSFRRLFSLKLRGLKPSLAMIIYIFLPVTLCLAPLWLLSGNFD